MNGVEYPPDESVRKELVAQVRGVFSWGLQDGAGSAGWRLRVLGLLGAWLMTAGLGHGRVAFQHISAAQHSLPTSAYERVPPRVPPMQVRKAIGPIATPDVIHWAPGLPKTRSGKIMRRVLRKIASREEDQLGDTSTLADPGVVNVLLELRGK